MSAIRQAVYNSGSGAVISWHWGGPTIPGNMLLVLITTNSDATWGGAEGYGTPSNNDGWVPNDGAGHTGLVTGPFFYEPGTTFAWTKSTVEHVGTESFTYTYFPSGSVNFTSWHVAAFEMNFQGMTYDYSNSGTGLTVASYGSSPRAFNAQTTAWDAAMVTPTAPGYQIVFLNSPTNTFEAVPTLGAPDNGYSTLTTWDQVSNTTSHSAVAIYGKDVAAAGDDIETDVSLSASRTWQTFSWGFYDPTDEPDPPVNDDFADAILISGVTGTTSAVTIDGATVETGEDNTWSANHQTVWYKWVCPETDLYEFSTEGSLAGDYYSGDDGSPGVPPYGNLDTRLAVWTGTVLGSLTEVASDDDADDGAYSSLAFEAVQGTTYYFQVGTFNSPYIGTVVLTWTNIIRSPRIRDRTTGAWSAQASRTPTLPIHEPLDAVTVMIGVESDTATISTPAGWTELFTFTVTAAAAPWTRGSTWKMVYKIADGYNITAPTLNFDGAHNGLSVCAALEGPIDTTLTEVTAASHNAAETHFPDPPSIDNFATGHLPAVQSVIAASDNQFITQSFTRDESTSVTAGSNDGTGIAAIHEIQRVHTGESFNPPSVTVNDNSALAGTHYAPSTTISIAWYSSGEPDRLWTIGSNDNGTGSSGQSAQGGKYIYRLSYNGFTTATRVGVFKRYDIEADTWATLTPIPGKYRAFHACAVHGGKVYVFLGTEGNNGVSPSDTRITRIYDIATDTWSTGTSTPDFVIGHLDAGCDSTQLTIDVDEDAASLMGDGAFSSTTLRIENERLRITGNKVSLGGGVYRYPVQRARNSTSGAAHSAGAAVVGEGGTGVTPGGSDYACALTVGNTIYLMGGSGIGANEPVDDAAWAYHPLTDTWTQLAQIPAGQDFGNIVVDSDGLIHAIGSNVFNIDDSGVPFVDPTFTFGIQENGHQVYDPDTDTWELKENMPFINSHGYEVEAFQAMSLYDPVTDDIVTIPFQNLGFAGTGYANDRFVERYNVGTDTWSSDPSIDADPHNTATGYYGNWLPVYDAMGTAVWGTRRVFVQDGGTAAPVFAAIVYYDVEVGEAVDVLSTIATIDHDLLIGVEEDQHHPRQHALDSDDGPHTGGLFYKSGTGFVSISDADFISPANGMVAVTYSTDTGMRLVWARANGLWKAVEA